MKICSTNLLSKTARAREQNILEKVHLPPTCHVLGVTFHVSHVMCHMYYCLLFVLQSDEATQWRVGYHSLDMNQSSGMKLYLI